MRAHLHCGLGFNAHQLCKAELSAQKLAEAVSFTEAEAAVEDSGDGFVRI